MKLFHLLGACAAISCVAMQVQAAPSTRSPEARTSNSAACEAAKRSTWFERQRQLTDGDVDPSKALPVPRECMDMSARSKEAAQQEAQQDAAASAADRKTAEGRKEGGIY